MSRQDSVKGFSGVLFRPDGIGTWTYVSLPFDVEEAFGSRGQVPVRGTVNGSTFRSSLMPRGDGTHYLVVGAELRAEAGAGVGDIIDVRVELDSEPREVDVPEDLREAISAIPQADEFWTGLAYSYRKEYVRWIEDAKREETRKSRIAKAAAMLAEHKKLK